ncbi:MAG: ATP-grasp domain-containing protein [Smithellaceae bacterium]|nr:ATP-grasp domain-containing protein [Smithellaceae bacterium]
MRILLVGISTRALAESAVLSGCGVITLDYYGDRDQKALVENHSLLRDLNLPCRAEELVKASKSLEFDAVVYTANLENHPKLVAMLAQRSILLGNPPRVLRRVRDWQILRQVCDEEKIPCPVTLLRGEEGEASQVLRWLYKPMQGGGGNRIRSWGGEPIGKAHVLQAYITGTPASMVFAADGQRSVVIGLTEQLIGRKEMGARGFRWCGNIIPLKIDPSKRDVLLGVVEKMAARLTRRFGLRGVNGVDLIVAEGADGEPKPFLVEVNPRYTASMELVERAYGLNVFSVHLEAIAGRLPDFSLAEHLEGVYLGKGIVFARKTVTMPETAGWAERGRRDIPFPGERIAAAHPICTVFAEGKGRDVCLKNLFTGVEEVRREIGDEIGG